jgi:hypothetical protein
MGFYARQALIGHDSEAIHQHYVSAGEGTFARSRQRATRPDLMSIQTISNLWPTKNTSRSSGRE